LEKTVVEVKKSISNSGKLMAANCFFHLSFCIYFCTHILIHILIIYSLVFSKEYKLLNLSSDFAIFFTFPI